LKETKPEKECPAGVCDCPFAGELALLKERCRRLEELSYVDALTGLFNFRHLQRSLEMEMERTRRSRLPTSLIMSDLDHFKAINTQYGHEAGNAALVQVGAVFRENTRMIDIPCRYGGEEFALIMPGTSLVQATNIAERLRTVLKSTPFMLNGEKVVLTASYGVAIYTYSDDWTANDFLGKADSFLYQAKTGGRNRVCAQQIVIPTLPTVGVTQDEKDGLFAEFRTDEDEGR